jgi:hypothetical protein
MSGDTTTRLAIAVAVGLGVVLAALILFTAGGSDSRDASIPKPSPAAQARQLGPADADVLTKAKPSIKDWNSAAHAWIRALGTSRTEFLRSSPGYTRRLDLDSLRIRLAASQIENPRLRSLMRRLGDVYRTQFMAIRDANEAVIASDEPSTRAAIARLERADDQRIRVATALFDAFPQLTGDVSRLK